MRLALLILAWLGPRELAPPGTEGAPQLRVEAGRARVLQEREVRALDRLSGEVALALPATLECGASSALEVRWRGGASVGVTGPALLELDAAPRLRLVDFRAVEIEVRRGALALEIPGLVRAELGAGVLELVSLPGGGVEVLNRGGDAIALSRRGTPVTVDPGRRLRILPAR